MNNPDYVPHPFEPTSDELPAGSRYHFAIDRRKFLGLTGGGLVVAFTLRDILSDESKSLFDQESADPVTGVDSWIRIGADGNGSGYTGKVEVGENILTSV